MLLLFHLANRAPPLVDTTVVSARAIDTDVTTTRAL